MELTIRKSLLHCKNVKPDEACHFIVMQHGYWRLRSRGVGSAAEIVENGDVGTSGEGKGVSYMKNRINC